MEYALRDAVANANNGDHNKVLILVLMEYALRELRHFLIKNAEDKVLILVLMEYALRVPQIKIVMRTKWS